MSFDALYAEHLPAMRRYARGRARNEADVDDLLQELFLRLAKRLRDGVDERFVPQVWLFIVLANLCRSYGRRKTYHQLHELEPVYATEDGPVAHPLLLAMEAREGNPERELEAKTMRIRIRSAAACLSERECTALTLRELRGLNSREMAKRMGKSERATTSALAAAKRKFRERYRALEAVS